MENEFKKKVVKYGGASVVIGSLVFGGGIALYDANLNHADTLCPLVSILGVQHQVDKINDIDGLFADTKTSYYAPSGYNLTYIDGKPIVYKRTINQDGSIHEVYGSSTVKEDIIITNEAEEIVNIIPVR